MVEHAAHPLNKFSLSVDGHTAFGRLHGRDLRETYAASIKHALVRSSTETSNTYGEVEVWGVCLGRAVCSDQNIQALHDGTVVPAKARARLNPEMRWSTG